MFKRVAVLTAVLALALGQTLALAADDAKAPANVPSPTTKPGNNTPTTDRDLRVSSGKKAVEEATGELSNMQWGLIAGGGAAVIGLVAANRTSSSGATGTH